MAAERSEAQAQGSGRGSRRRHSTQYKREVVSELLKPGVCVREVAQRHGLHESLVSAWRRRYSQDELQETRRPVSQAKLLRVRLPPAEQGRAKPIDGSLVADAVGSIHIELSQGHRLSLHGQVDANALSMVIRELSRS
jgi:transposase-like protein